jgi:hypothetical protein
MINFVHCAERLLCRRSILTTERLSQKCSNLRPAQNGAMCRSMKAIAASSQKQMNMHLYLERVPSRSCHDAGHGAVSYHAPAVFTHQA